jgi:protein phosphatase
MGRPGSTCVALLVHGGAVEVAHVGDSRAYFIRNGHIWPLTKDHSVVQQLLDQGAITPEQAVLHPEGNKITRALGMKPDTEVELRDPPLLQAVGDIFVLATDGLVDLVRTEEIGSVVMQAASLDLAGQNLIAMANARGGHDNITVLLARVLPGGAAGATVTQEPLAPTIVETRSGAAPGAPTPGAVSAPVAGASAPEKTLVDRSLGGAPGAPAPFAPTPPAVPPYAAPPNAQALFAPTPPAVPIVPGSPNVAGAPPVHGVGPITEPLHAVPMPPGQVPHAPAPAPLPNTIPPAPPTRSGMLIAIAALVVLFLIALVVWTIVRGR